METANTANFTKSLDNWALPLYRKTQNAKTALPRRHRSRSKRHTANLVNAAPICRENYGFAGCPLLKMPGKDLTAAGAAVAQRRGPGQDAAANACLKGTGQVKDKAENAWCADGQIRPDSGSKCGVRKQRPGVERGEILRLSSGHRADQNGMADMRLFGRLCYQRRDMQKQIPGKTDKDAVAEYEKKTRIA